MGNSFTMPCCVSLPTSKSFDVYDSPVFKEGNPKVKKKSEGGLGMQSVKYGLDNNTAITAADPKAKFIATNKKAGGGMPKMPKYRDGGAFRGCGAQVKGKKFKGIF